MQESAEVGGDIAISDEHHVFDPDAVFTVSIQAGFITKHHSHLERGGVGVSEANSLRAFMDVKTVSDAV